MVVSLRRAAVLCAASYVGVALVTAWLFWPPLAPGRSLPVGPGLGARVEAEGPARCPCPAPEGQCLVPCTACCDDPKTPEIEQCPCDPTAAQ